ncbi:hypothetical protein [Chromohalobacter canadensis]|uniref:hypothetical protein n=1 Tax=Chromohalobacter canadensis TaxID=141389 RepID=UPI0024108C8A|nr:hypothetical protein [Chromohalobacter canadensis]
MKNYPYAVYNEDNTIVGHLLKDASQDEALLKAKDGDLYNIPYHHLKQQEDHWILTRPLLEFSKAPPKEESQEHIDDMSKDSFPASDPPDYTLGGQDETPQDR